MWRFESFQSVFIVILSESKFCATDRITMKIWGMYRGTVDPCKIDLMGSSPIFPTKIADVVELVDTQR